MKKSVIIIPALNPDERLIPYVNELINNGFEKIILIDDGSDEKHKAIFDEVSKKTECEILKHYINMGKGRALKDAFNYYLSDINKENEYNGVITVDSDGQHAVKNVIEMDKELEKNPDKLILGVRDFDSENVPFKSKFGNKATKNIMKLMYGGNISDTQTGLRAIPNKLIPMYLTLKGERFEYETGQLIETLRNKVKIVEVKIETIYDNENKGTHFRPIADSIAIYGLIFATFIKYSCSSLSAAVIDLIAFSIFSGIFGKFSVEVKIWCATVFARIISSLFNYKINEKVVFKSKNKKKSTIFKYYLLVIIQMSCSAFLVSILNKYLISNAVIAKFIIDALLFLVSYQIQRKFIF